MLHEFPMFPDGRYATEQEVEGGQSMRVIGGLILLGLVAACAPTPESIQPAYVSEVPYQSWTCQQLGEEVGRLRNALATASTQQSSARSNDIAGVILLGLPVGSMSGQSIAPQIARYKGEEEAVNKAMIRNNCGYVPRLDPSRPEIPATAPRT